MRTVRHVLFWFIVDLALVVGFGSSYDDYGKTFYFISFLLPVAIGTSYFFNYFLVPKYLLEGKIYYFAIYTAYTIIVSLYFMMIVITLSFVILSNYNYQDLDPFMKNIFVLAVTIYMIVFAKAFVIIYRRFKEQESEKKQLVEEKDALKTEFITVRTNRINRQIQLEEVIYLESMSDYVNIHTRSDVIKTKENISHFESILPEYFIRIHRSFIVNQNFVTTFKSSELIANGISLPISRSYKKQALELLEENHVSSST